VTNPSSPDRELDQRSREGIAELTEASSERPPASANFINPETVHPPFGYSHVVEVTAGRPVYIAGQVALDPTGALVGAGDIRAQTRQVFDNLRAALEAVGAGFEQVVKLNFYLVDATHLPVIREVRDQYVNTRQPPASTAVEVRRLFREDALIEVEAVAVIAPTEPSGR
jgi:enamine deaminase RidA (YjgF/YER057c/UK114 family)